MLALFLILACAPTDPVEACVRLIELECACGLPEQYCDPDGIEDRCTQNVEDGAAETDEANCIYRELSGCENRNWTAEERDQHATEAYEICAAAQ